MKGRITTGFHRLGLLLATPPTLVGLGIAAWAVTRGEGLVVPDPQAIPQIPVVTWGEPMPAGQTDPRGPRDRFPIDQGMEIEIDQGHVLVLRSTDSARPLENVPTREMSDAQLMRLSSAMKSITTAERRRGSIYKATEMPIVVGDIFVSAGDTETIFPSYLKRGPDWESTKLGLLMSGVGLLLYGLIRCLGWILNGFFPPNA